MFLRKFRTEGFDRDDGKFPPRFEVGNRQGFECCQALAATEHAFGRFRFPLLPDADEAALRTLEVELYDIAISVTGNFAVFGHVLGPQPIDVRLHLVRVGQGNVSAILALPVGEGVIPEFDKLFGVRIDNGGTLDVGAAANRWILVKLI